MQKITLPQESMSCVDISALGNVPLAPRTSKVSSVVMPRLDLTVSPTPGSQADFPPLPERGTRHVSTFPRITRDIDEEDDKPLFDRQNSNLELETRKRDGPSPVVLCRVHSGNRTSKSNLARLKRSNSSFGDNIKRSSVFQSNREVEVEKPLIRKVDGFVVENPSSGCEAEVINWDREEKIYFNDFYEKSHVNFIGVDQHEGVITISILFPEQLISTSKRKSRISKRNSSLEPKFISSDNDLMEKGKSLSTRAIVRSANLNLDIRFPVKMHKSTLKPKDLVKRLCMAYPRISLIKPRQLVSPNSKQLLLQYEETMICSTFKFGVIYCRPDQISEEDMYMNEKGSVGFSQFLGLLGDTVDLLHRDGWVGGLDTTENKDGLCGVYTKFYNKEIMFHVSTMLRHVPDDKQQIAKKRHIGNDVVVIIYQDDIDPKSFNSEIQSVHSFSPALISSRYNHIFIIVRRLYNSEKIMYRVGVTSREGVMGFKPKQASETFEHGAQFRNWMLQKCINGELAAYQSDGFRSSREKAQQAQLLKILSHHNSYISSLKSSSSDNK
jgi:hypothetical protein